MTERNAGAADKVGVAAKRPNFIAELRRPIVIRMAGWHSIAYDASDSNDAGDEDAYND